MNRPRPATVVARLTNASAFSRDVQRRLAQRHARVLLESGGRRMNRYFGAPVLVLETVGRRSGARRVTPLIYLADAAGWVVVPANGGADRVPAWWLNLQAAGTGTVVVAGAKHEVGYRVAVDAERERLWTDFAQQYPSLDDYTTMTERALPVVVLTPVGR